MSKRTHMPGRDELFSKIATLEAALLKAEEKANYIRAKIVALVTGAGKPQKQDIKNIVRRSKKNN